MAVKIIYGTSPGVRNAACLNAMSASQGQYSRIFYIVPETLSYDAETRVCEKFGVSCPLTAEVLSFKRLYHAVVTQYGMSACKKISDSAKSLLFSYICKKHIDDFKVLKKAANHAGIGETLNTVVQELKTYNISDEKLKSAISDSNLPEKLKAKLHDIEIIYSEYAKHLDGAFNDAQDEMDILANLLIKHPDYFKNSLVVADGFEMFTPKESLILSAIMRSCKDALFAFNCDSESAVSEYDTFITVKKCIRNIKKIASDLNIEVLKSEKINDENFYENIPDIKHFLDEIAMRSEKKYSDKVKNISVSVFNKETDEISFVADEIMRLVREKNVRFKDITVVARNAEAYNSIIKRTFDKYNIPVFVDTKSDALSQPAIYSLFCALNCITTGFSKNAIISYIKSGFTNLNSIEAGNLENYILSTGICKNSFISGKYFTYLPYMSKGLDEKEFLNNINETIKKVNAPLIKLKNSFESAPDFTTKCLALYNFATDISLYEKIESTILRIGNSTLQTASYYSQVWNTFIDTLDEISDVLGNAPCSVSEFSQMLSIALSIHKISVIPTLKDCVTVSPDAKVSCSKYVFVIGACDGVYPMVSSDEGIINDSDRHILKEFGIELAPDTNEKAMDENLVLYNIVNLCKEKLYISYPVSDISGASKFPAAIIGNALKIFGKDIIIDRITESYTNDLNMITSPAPTFERFSEKLRNYADGAEIDDVWLQSGSWFSKNEKWRLKTDFCRDMFAPAEENLFISPDLYPATLNMSVSRLETYRKCPFSYFAQYVLNLQQRKTTDVLNSDAGSIVHFVLDSLSKTVAEKFGSWNDVTDDFIEAEVSRLVSFSIEETEKQYDEHLASRLWQLSRLKSKLIISVVQIARHLRNGKFVPLGYEIEFGEECGKFEAYQTDINGKKIKLRGKIDRADIYIDEDGNKFIKIIDYKSSSHDFDISMFKNGLQLQLAVYLDRMCEAENALPGGMLYFKIHDPVISSECISDLNSTNEIDTLIERDFKMSGIILDNSDVISAMDNNAAGFESDILPIKQAKKSGEKKGVLSLDEFTKLREDLEKTVNSISSQLTSGNVSVRPVLYKSNSTTKLNGCSYCPFMDTCHFDAKCGSRFEFIFDKKEGEPNA